MMGVAITTAAAVVTAMVKAAGGASGAGVAQGTADGATLVATTGVVDEAMAEDVQRGTARQPPPARRWPQAPTTARWP